MGRFGHLTVAQQERITAAARLRILPQDREAFFADASYALAACGRQDDEAISAVLRRLLGVAVYTDADVGTQTVEVEG